jgi:hypothetical protein
MDWRWGWLSAIASAGARSVRRFTSSSCRALTVSGR